MLSIFSTLNNASETRRELLNCFLMLESVSQSRINKALIKDNLKIAQVLQTLFKIKSFKKDFSSLSREHALAVLNLTHYILDVGLAENQMIPDYDIFLKRAHILLNRLADYLRLLPDEIAISGVGLLDEHPVNHGGFSNIYRGMYTNPAGEQVEVALKVLKIFQDQSDERRQILHDKFAKEALVWHYLKHKNIVPFLGVDFTTFPSPARAMVSPWMPEGSVLKYMAEHSPTCLYALDLLSDVTDGLSYLHSRNLVHGDLCGRNILMDGKGRARLTDFGLAVFVESDTSIKASTRSGSTRWMAPELLLPAPGAHFKRSPASDVWAFGCVCCEIWSEGDVPFSYIATETGIIFSVADLTESTPQVLPYQSKPRDKAGNSMPDALWELVQWCWKLDPSQRPEVQVICAMVSDIAAHLKRLEIGHREQLEVPVASGSRVSSSPVGSALSRASIEPPKVDKGKQRAHFEDVHRTVLFGPLDVDGDPEDIFGIIFDELRTLVHRDAVMEPVLVETHDTNHLALRFHSLVDANNFAMTWTVHRFEPFLQVSAILW
ncbi:kinase-like domain-containing protein [Mycena leptocephala]|nr:kinase-like domain-containing protein [Mycena leptocephala]